MNTRAISVILFVIYFVDILAKKILGSGVTFLLPYTVAYLTLFIAVGFFLISILPDMKKLD